MRTTLMSATLIALALAGCDLAGPVERQSEASRKAVEANELKDHIQQPIDRAKNANDPVIEADKARAQAIEDAGG
jgi:hypothetical protein